MKKKIFFIVVFFCLVIIVVNFGNLFFVKTFGLQTRAGLKIISSPEAVVFLNGIETGKTPFEDENLNAGDFLVKLSADNLNWQGWIRLTKGTMSIINRTLGSNLASSSGETLVLDKGEGIIITSAPTNSEVEIDGKIYGVTPLSLPFLDSGEHNVTLSHEGYMRRNVNIILPQNTRLHINIDLPMAKMDLANIPTPTAGLAQKIIIKQTPLGYLRVREKPLLSSKEIGRVFSGNEFIILEELQGWVKINLENNQEGYISTQYLQKVTQ